MMSFDYKNLENPRCFAIGRMPAHSDHIVSKNKKEAVLDESSYRISLNGLWKFKYSANLADMPSGFENEDADCKLWDEIRVPAHLQMEGYGIPQYVNTQYPWDGIEELTPPAIPIEKNPIGNYVKYFSLPDDFVKNGLYIRFDGIESAFCIWLNGHFIGYSSDSFDAKEFDLTDFAYTDKENKLAVQVFKYNSGSWMEDQDMFRFSGIFRDVTLFTRTNIDVYDIKCVTNISDDFKDAALNIELKGRGKGTLKFDLYEQSYDKNTDSFVLSNESIWHDEKSYEKNITFAKEFEGVEFSNNRNLCEKAIDVKAELKNVKLWSAEKPNLYSLVISLVNESGYEEGVIRQEIGFRKFELGNDNIMRINGKRIVFNGTNRHEFSARYGRALRKKDMETDVKNMKRANINALRMSHYPNNSYMYKLCDRYGLYVIDENNLETHGTWEPFERGIKDESYIVPKDNKIWQDMLLDRGTSMLERDKNHPCVIIWSCGNEAHGGSVIYELSKMFKKKDATRLVHYEGLCHDRRYNDTSDMESRMYPPVVEIKDFLKEHRDKPFICCEYTHAMGNSCGAMYKYTDLTKEDDLYQGGFIWDYIDQSIMMKDRYGKEFQGYGGDSGERPTDFDFCGNGIAFGDDNRTPSPKMQSVKYNYQPFTILIDSDKDSVKIKNYSLFTNSNEYTIRVKVEYYSKTIYIKDIEADIAPGCEKEISLGIKELIEEEEICSKKGEYVIFVSMLLKEDTIYADKGYEVAFGSDVFVKLSDEEIITYIEDDISDTDENENDNPLYDFVPSGIFGCGDEITLYKNKELKVIHGPNNIGVKGENFEAIFSEIAEGLISYKYGGVELIKNAPKPNFWRAPTQNDIGNGMPMHHGQWKLASMYARCKIDLYTKYDHFLGGVPIVLDEYEDHVSIRYNYKLPTTPQSECFVTYDVYGDGTIKTTLSYDPVKELGDMPEFGMIMKMDADFHKIKWYGNGKEETYEDRVEGAKLSVYENDITNSMAPYLLPQESGNHTGVRYASVTDDKNRGLLFASCDSFGMSFNASAYTPHEVENAAHGFELPNVHYSVIRTSLMQMGIAGDNTWGAFTHKEHRINVDNKLTFSYAMRGI